MITVINIIVVILIITIMYRAPLRAVRAPLNEFGLPSGLIERRIDLITEVVQQSYEPTFLLISKKDMDPI